MLCSKTHGYADVFVQLHQEASHFLGKTLIMLNFVISFLVFGESEVNKGHLIKKKGKQMCLINCLKLLNYKVY